MKKIFFSFLFLSFICTSYAQDKICYTPNQGDLGLSISAETLLNLSGMSNMEDIARGKYFFTDDLAVTLGVSALGLETAYDKAESSTGIFFFDFGFQYFWTTEKRLRPFTGISIAYAKTKEDLRYDDLTLDIRYQTPYFCTIGIGAEFFLYPNVSISSDVSFLFSYFSPNKKTFPSFFYATCVGGLGGKLALNVYF